jgi:hypothetical protein
MASIARFRIGFGLLLPDRPKLLAATWAGSDFSLDGSIVLSLAHRIKEMG